MSPSDLSLFKREVMLCSGGFGFEIAVHRYAQDSEKTLLVKIRIEVLRRLREKVVERARVVLGRIAWGGCAGAKIHGIGDWRDEVV